jgi:small nuclear ribonucleoprotein (snRNP)-like protein
MLNTATTTAIDALKIITKFIENKKNTIEDMQPDSVSFLDEATNNSMNVLLHEVIQQIKIVLDYSNSLPKSLEHLEEYRKKLKEERKTKIRGNKVVNPFAT